MKVCDLALGDSITLQCATCQSAVRWSTADPERIVGPRADLNNIGLYDRLRCRGCGRPSAVQRLAALAATVNQIEADH